MYSFITILFPRLLYELHDFKFCNRTSSVQFIHIMAELN